jgi:AraC-like DNA-binding protein
LRSGCWVKEAAGQAQFKDVSSFCRWFKAQQRVPPSEFASTASVAKALSSPPEDWSI